MKNKEVASVLGITAAILLISLVGTQISDEWNWSIFDFGLIGTLLLGTGLLVVLASRKIKNINRRAVVILAIIAALLITWVELAVGIFN